MGFITCPQTASGGGKPPVPPLRAGGGGGDDDESDSGDTRYTFGLVDVIQTFGLYMMCDTLSNFIQHPGKRMDYGALNALIGQEVDQSWWGTRLEHIVGVALALAVTDHASQAIFAASLGKTISFATTPVAFVLHTFLFIFTGVAAYCLYDAALNPAHASDRVGVARGEIYNTYLGSNAAWFEPFVPVAAARISGAFAASWAGSSLLPATLCYTAVKGTGWNDWGEQGLSPHERRLNGLDGKNENVAKPKK